MLVPTETPIIRDMRQTARDFGVVDQLLRIKRCNDLCPRCEEMLSDVLETMAVTDQEAANAELRDEGIDPTI